MSPSLATSASWSGRTPGACVGTRALDGVGSWSRNRRSRGRVKRARTAPVHKLPRHGHDSPASARWRAPPPTRCSRSTTPGTARCASGSARAPCSTSGAASASETAELAGLGPHGHRRRLQRRDRGRRGARDWAPSGLRFAAMDGAALGVRDRTDRLGVLVAHHRALRSHPSSTSPSSRASATADGTAFVITPEPPRRLREPVPRVPVRGRRARVAARASSSTTSTVHGLEGSPELHADFAQRRASGEKLLQLDPLDLRQQGAAELVRVGLRARAARSCTRRSARRRTGIGSGLDESHFFLTDQIEPTTPGLFAMASRPRV